MLPELNLKINPRRVKKKYKNNKKEVIIIDELLETERLESQEPDENFKLLPVDVETEPLESEEPDEILELIPVDVEPEQDMEIDFETHSHSFESPKYFIPVGTSSPIISNNNINDGIYDPPCADSTINNVMLTPRKQNDNKNLFKTKEVKAISTIFADSIPYITKLLPDYDKQKNEIKESKSRLTKDFLLLQKELREKTIDKISELRTSYETWEDDFKKDHDNSYPEMEDLNDKIRDMFERINIGKHLMDSWTKECP